MTPARVSADSDWRTQRRLPNTLWAWWRLQRMAIRAQGQYRGNFFVGMIGGVTYQGLQVAFLAILLHRFNLIGGWNFREIGLLFGIRLAAHALYVMPFNPVSSTDRMIRVGDFDRVLLRPVNIFIQVSTRRFQIMSVGDGLIGICALIVFWLYSPVHWTPLKVGYALCAVVAGGLVETAIQAFIAAIAFTTTSTSGFAIFADQMFSQFGSYPLTIFGRIGVWVLTFAFPIAFVSYLPTTVLLGRADQVPLPSAIIHLSPLLGVGLFAVSVWTFTRRSRKYVSPSGGTE